VYKDYYALVVGIGNYEKWPRLPNAVNDAKEVAAKLKELGFEVRLVIDPTSREMETVLSEMVYEMGREKNRALLFYYAGHGETEILADRTKIGYIIPRDCPQLQKDPKGFATHAVSMRDIESVSMRIWSKHVLMLFDSCFSGSIFSLVRAVPHDITEKSALPVRQYITAGRDDEQVPDKSIFKRCFLIGLEGDADLTGDGYITGSELGMYLSDKVINYTHRRQHPQYGKINNPDLDRGDFIFVPLHIQEKAAEEENIQKEKTALAQELERMRKEREETKGILEEMKQLLAARSQAEEREEEILAEKQDLEKKINQAIKERQTVEELAGAKAEKLTSKLSVAEEKLRKEAAEKRALEEELNRVKAEMEKTSGKDIEVKAKQLEEKQLASIHVKEEKPQQKPPKTYNLAIFPFFEFNQPLYASGLKENIINAVLELIKDYPNIQLTHSYYKNDKFYKGKEIEYINDIIDNKLKGEVWFKESLFSKKKPNIKAIKELREKIHADLVLTYSISTTDIGGDHMLFDLDFSGYLIDVENNNVCHESRLCKDQSMTGDFDCLKSMTKILFDSY